MRARFCSGDGSVHIDVPAKRLRKLRREGRLMKNATLGVTKSPEALRAFGKALNGEQVVVSSDISQEFVRLCSDLCGTSLLQCGIRKIEVSMDLLKKLRLFSDHPEFLVAEYEVKSTDNVEKLRDFLRRMRNEVFMIDREDAILGLCEEFGYQGLEGVVVSSRYMNTYLGAHVHFETRFLRELSRQRGQVETTPSVGWEDVKLDRAHPLHGIISRLTVLHRRPVCEAGVLEVSGAFDPRLSAGDPKNAVNLWNLNSFISVPKPDQSLCIDFKERRVAPSAYTIMSGKDHYPRSWVVEASNDGKQWVIIDRRVNNHELAGDWRIVSFSVGCESLYRMFRIRQMGVSHFERERNVFEEFIPLGHEYILDICGFELFGRTQSIGLPKRVHEVPANPIIPMHGILSYLSALTSGEILSHVPVHGVGHKELWDGRLSLFSSVEGEPNKTLCVDFMDFRVIPNKYAMTYGPKNVVHSWVVEVSNDGFIWKEVDRQIERPWGSAVHFEIHNCSEPVRIIRVRDFARKRAAVLGWLDLMIMEFEVFGRVIDLR